jgi:hypothetical protein
MESGLMFIQRHDEWAKKSFPKALGFYDRRRSEKEMTQ